MIKKINLAIIFGGKSSEHEISLASASGIFNALDKQKYNIMPIAITKKGIWLIGKKAKEYLANYKKDKSFFNNLESDLPKFLKSTNKKIDLVLPIIHGNYGEDGKLQGMLEMLGLPYLFSNTLTSALAMNKVKSKVVVSDAGLKVAKHIILSKNIKYSVDSIIDKLALPLVVKPIEGGSSVGIFVTKNRHDLEKNIQESLKYGSVMLEEYKEGRELTVGIMGDRTPKILGITEIIPKKSSFYDFESKYKDGGSEHVCPANIPNSILAKIKEEAIKAYVTIGARDLARIDFIWSQNNNKLYFLEINTIPGMTQTSLAPEQAKVLGLNFSQFLDELISLGVSRVNN